MRVNTNNFNARFSRRYEIIDEGFGDGSIRKCDRNNLARAVIGALNSTVHWHDAKGP